MPNDMPVAQSKELVAAICGILADVLGCGVEEITLDASLEYQLGMDSLSAIETSVALEERFGVKMPEFATPDELGLHTVADLVALTVSKVQELERN